MFGYKVCTRAKSDANENETQASEKDGEMLRWKELMRAIIMATKKSEFIKAI